jgi:hypothetical protein
VERIYFEKLYRLLTEPLYSSWSGPEESHSFLALANVSYFHTWKQPPLVPDILLSLDAAPAADLRVKEGHSYFQWLIGKPPEVTMEMVSERRGGEADWKMKAYAQQRALYYVIYDPDNLLQGGVLRAYKLQGLHYELADPRWFPEVGLGLILWQGVFEIQQETWLRWCDQQGKVIPTGAERADEAAAQLQRLAAQLRALGVEPQA